MRVISPFLKHVVYPGLSRSGYLRRSASAAPVVVTYHGIFPKGYEVRDAALDGHLVMADAFVRQVQLLKAKYNVITPEEFLRWREGELRLPPRAVLLTCDDGLLNTLTDMLPLAKELDVRLLIFVTGQSLTSRSAMLWYEKIFLWLLHAGGRISFSAPWGECAAGRGQIVALWRRMMRKLSMLEEGARNQILEDIRTQLGIAADFESEYSRKEATRRRFFMLNLTQVREMANAGMTIGAHTLSHPMLSQMAEKSAWEEISKSRDGIETGLGKSVWALAYPFGNAEAVSARETSLAERAGFRCAFMNVEDDVGGGWFAFPRIHVSSGMRPAELEAHVSGFYRRARDRYAAAGAGVPA